MLGFARVPDFSTASDGKSTFIVYNIHFNGFYHSSLRYSQLLELHSELKANFDTTQLEEFPPKHWRSTLTEEQQTQRRILLERFVQSVCQHRAIGPSEKVKEFFLGAQKACTDLTVVSGDLEVYLVNGKKVTVTVAVSDRSDQVLEQVCSKIELNPELTYYFGLFLERENTTSDVCEVVCPLTDYQSPFITLHSANKRVANYRVTLRQNFWESTFVPTLLDDKVAKNMLYIEALHSVAKGHIDVTMETREKLAAMKSKGQKKEYLECISTVVQYGYRHLEGFTFNYPTEGLKGCVRVGKQEVVTYTGPSEDGTWRECHRYPLNRIKSWKVGFQGDTCWLKMNCQVSLEQFAWVCLTGDKAIFLSFSLHSTVNELLRVRSKQPIRSPALQPIQRVQRDFPPIVITAHTPTNGIERSSSSEGQRSPTVEPAARERISSSSSGAGVSSTDGGVTTTREGGGASASKPYKAKKTSKAGVSDTENPTFNFGTDDDL